MPEEIWFYLAVVLGVIAVASTVILLMEREKRKLPEDRRPTQKTSLVEGVWPLTVSRSVPDEVVKETRDRLRILDLEREILSYAIRRLYEAQAEGKITVEERDSLAQKYREDLERIRQEIARGESIIALSELERMQEEFIKMFSERLETLNRRIEDLKAIAGLAPLEPVSKPREEPAKREAERAKELVVQQHEKAAAPKRKREASKSTTSLEEAESAAAEAEKKVEQIMAEVEKVLSRLSQMEVEE